MNRKENAMVRNAKHEQSSSNQSKGTAMSSHHQQLAGPHRGFFGPVGQLREEFDRLLDQFFPSSFLSSGRQDWRWGLDCEESDDEFVVRAEAPGFEPADFDLQVRDHQLVLSASKKTESGEDDGHGWQQRELFRSVTLPAGIDAEKVDAEYRNGILTVKLPKTEHAKGRRIEVKS
jgi:HSP20 family protein